MVRKRGGPKEGFLGGNVVPLGRGGKKVLVHTFFFFQLETKNLTLKEFNGKKGKGSNVTTEEGGP